MSLQESFKGIKERFSGAKEELSFNDAWKRVVVQKNGEANGKNVSGRFTNFSRGYDKAYYYTLNTDYAGHYIVFTDVFIDNKDAAIKAFIFRGNDEVMEFEKFGVEEGNSYWERVNSDIASNSETLLNFKNSLLITPDSTRRFKGRWPDMSVKNAYAEEINKQQSAVV